MNGRGSAELDGAVEANDLQRVDDILRGVGDSPGSDIERSGSGKPLLASAHSIEMAAKLLEHGFEISDVSRWWASGLFVNPGVDPHVGRFLVDRGASYSSRRRSTRPCRGSRRDARCRFQRNSCPGRRRLHTAPFCTQYRNGRASPRSRCERQMRDDDHDSTPAQWLIAASPDVVAFLLEHGATPDIFLAASLGNRPLAERLIAADRSMPSHRIGKPPFHPIGYQGRGGTILQWTLGFNRYAHQIALQKGHQELFDFLIAESDVTTRFLVACVMADRPAAEAIIASSPGLVAKLPDADLELLARYCWETNMSVEAVRLMLDVGFPVEFPERSHGFSPLHNAAWGGYGELVELLVQRGHPVAVRDPNFNGTPLDWAVHYAVRDGRHPDGEYGRVARALIDAGCPWDRSNYPTGNDAIDEVLRERING